MTKDYSIQQTAKILGVNPQTLRRWDKSGRLTAKRKQTGQISRYYYDENDIEDFLITDFKALFKLAKKWALVSNPLELPRQFHCQDRSIFKGRLSRLEYDLSRYNHLIKIFPLIVAVSGEIGNNSFDHNLGNWPDVSGAFFGYNLDERKIILADRGQGILKTLQRIKPGLSDHQEALKVAFTEMVSGRAPEARGNGLKFVKQVVIDNNFKLFFQSGDAVLNLSKKKKNINIEKSRDFIKGTLAQISY
ncbi:MerR family transcriptional regulator [Patescibacteria group bacterium]|nr:MerR family transcriptional regulator [Patescibacteria group bacterium]MBU0964203.1 MerR family transcriptional regulator [Patescibacteria group bacterium]